MTSQKDEIWKKHELTGVFSLPGGKGNYLQEPDFADIGWLRDKFADPELKSVIIRGSGRHFSAGASLEKLRALARDEYLLLRKMTAGKELIRFIEGAPLPVVAEIRGACLGGGLEIALACHVRICSENALFAFPETSHRIMPGLGGTALLPRVVGPGKAAEIILSADIVNAEKALEWKLVDYVVPEKELSAFTLAYVQKLTSGKDAALIRSVMAAIHNGLHMDMDRALEEETKLFCRLAARS